MGCSLDGDVGLIWEITVYLYADRNDLFERKNVTGEKGENVGMLSLQ